MELIIDDRQDKLEISEELIEKIKDIRMFRLWRLWW